MDDPTAGGYPSKKQIKRARRKRADEKELIYAGACDNGHEMTRIRYDPYDYGVTCNQCNRGIYIPHGFFHCDDCESDHCFRCQKERIAQYMDDSNN